MISEHSPDWRAMQWLNETFQKESWSYAGRGRYRYVDLTGLFPTRTYTRSEIITHAKRSGWEDEVSA